MSVLHQQRVNRERHDPSMLKRRRLAGFAGCGKSESAGYRQHGRQGLLGRAPRPPTRI